MENPLPLQLCTAYMPPLDYFASLLKVESFAVDERENYRKQTFRNRALIVTSQGVQVLSVPCIKTAGNHTPVGEVAVDSGKKWQRHHWRSICTAYNRSPFFLYYRDELETIIYRPWKTLPELNNALTDFFLAKLKLPVKRVQMPEYPEGSLPLDFTDKTPPHYGFDSYLQTFPSAAPLGHVSVLDLLFNTGPEAALILASAQRK